VVKKFRFKLQKVLDIRHMKEEMMKKKFAEALRRYEGEQARLSGLSDQLDREKKLEKEKRLQGRVSTVQAGIFADFFKCLQNNIMAQKIQVNQALNNLNQRRMELVNASKERKIIDKLHEKKREEYLLMIDKEEQKFIDEIAIQGAARKQENVDLVLR
jgi:flagellar protein FliJ